ncbi:hypothetical protein Pelo_15017 [Pelomyxa schiedti]|nr:hypothetical protein Pelo_15017 [Pelomyxa schiedti]
MTGISSSAFSPPIAPLFAPPLRPSSPMDTGTLSPVTQNSAALDLSSAFQNQFGLTLPQTTPILSTLMQIPDLKFPTGNQVVSQSPLAQEISPEEQLLFYLRNLPANSVSILQQNRPERATSCPILAQCRDDKGNRFEDATATSVSSIGRTPVEAALENLPRSASWPVLVPPPQLPRSPPGDISIIVRICRWSIPQEQVKLLWDDLVGALQRFVPGYILYRAHFFASEGVTVGVSAFADVHSAQVGARVSLAFLQNNLNPRLIASISGARSESQHTANCTCIQCTQLIQNPLQEDVVRAGLCTIVGVCNNW